jgi:hypothetical protein
MVVFVSGLERFLVLARLKDRLVGAALESRS